MTEYTVKIKTEAMRVDINFCHHGDVIHMKSFNLENGQPSSSPRLDQLIYRVVSYLKSRPSDDEILPKIVGKAIGESEISVTTVMRILEDRGVAKHHFGVYCGKTHVHLASLDDRPLPSLTVYCEVCDEDHCHAEEDCKVEVYYTIDEEKLAVFSLHISAA